MEYRKISQNHHQGYDGTNKKNKQWLNQHGHGIYTYSNGDKFVGDYKDDNENGQGTFT